MVEVGSQRNSAYWLEFGQSSHFQETNQFETQSEEGGNEQMKEEGEMEGKESSARSALEYYAASSEQREVAALKTELCDSPLVFLAAENPYCPLADHAFRLFSHSFQNENDLKMNWRRNWDDVLVELPCNEAGSHHIVVAIASAWLGPYLECWGRSSSTQDCEPVAGMENLGVVAFDGLALGMVEAYHRDLDLEGLCCIGFVEDNPFADFGTSC
jgi:hypothetical protein